MILTADQLARILPGAGEERIALYLPALNAGMAARGIDTPLRIAHFLSQIGHESGHLRWPEEIADGSRYEGGPTWATPSPATGGGSRAVG